MKVKGITIWEQYAEFIAIGIVAVVLVVYVVFQLSDDTNAVNVGGKTLGPDAVDAELQAKSEALARRIRDDADAPVTLEMPDPMSSRFETAMASNVSPADTVRIPGGRGADAGSSVDVLGAAVRGPHDPSRSSRSRCSSTDSTIPSSRTIQPCRSSSSPVPTTPPGSPRPRCSMRSPSCRY